MFEINRVNVVEEDFGIESLGMFLHALHQGGALQALDIPRPIVDISRGHQLATLGETGDHGRLEIGAGRINRSRVSGRAGSEDQEARVFRGRHV